MIETVHSLQINSEKIMYSSEDLERFYFQYQTEAMPHGESLQSFCVRSILVLIFDHKSNE